MIYTAQDFIEMCEDIFLAFIEPVRDFWEDMFCM